MGLLKNLNWVGKLVRITSWGMFGLLTISTIMYVIAFTAWGAPGAFSDLKSSFVNSLSLAALSLFGWVGFYELNERRLKLLFGLAGLLFLITMLF